jgi:hypothetical protein
MGNCTASHARNLYRPNHALQCLDTRASNFTVGGGHMDTPRASIRQNRHEFIDFKSDAIPADHDQWVSRTTPRQFRDGSTKFLERSASCDCTNWGCIVRTLPAKVVTDSLRLSLAIRRRQRRGPVTAWPKTRDLCPCRECDREEQ